MLRLLKYTVAVIVAMLTMTVAPPIAVAAEPMTDTHAADLVAIQQLVVKYTQSYDALDVEGYVSVFAEDAKFTFTGTTLNGREGIRKFITDAKQRETNAAASGPVKKAHHVLTNTLIEFVSANEARHRSYWEMVSGPAAGPFAITGMGVYEDVITKQNGKWLIKSRNIPQ